MINNFQLKKVKLQRLYLQDIGMIRSSLLEWMLVLTPVQYQGLWVYAHSKYYYNNIEK